jgi:ABC-2 type transport system permease protein
MNLLLTELRRLLSRRAVLFLLVLAFALPALIWVSHAWNTRPLGTEDVRDAIAQVQRQDRETLLECARVPADYGVEVPAGADPLRTCTEDLARSWYLNRMPLDLTSATSDVGQAVSVVVMGLLALAAATFAGADWHTGSISNQLLFEPRRARVWLAKGIAVALFAAVVTLVVLALWWATLGLLASIQGVAQSPGAWGAVVGLIGRTVPLSAAFALGAFALTMLLRSTVGTLGVLFTVSVGASLVITALPLEDPYLWMPHLNVQAWLSNGAEYWPMNGCATDEGCERRLELPRAGAYLGVLLVAVCAASLASFRRRDVS